MQQLVSDLQQRQLRERAVLRRPATDSAVQKHERHGLQRTGVHQRHQQELLHQKRRLHVGQPVRFERNLFGSGCLRKTFVCGREVRDQSRLHELPARNLQVQQRLRWLHGLSGGQVRVRHGQHVLRGLREGHLRVRHGQLVLHVLSERADDFRHGFDVFVLVLQLLLAIVYK